MIPTRCTTCGPLFNNSPVVRAHLERDNTQRAFTKGNIMHFNETTFTLATKVTSVDDMGKKITSDPFHTTITLLASDVDDKVVADALIAGNSPRVHWQSGARANGVPREATISWSDWIGKPRKASSTPVTAESAAALAERDPEFKRKLFAALGLQMVAEKEETEDEEIARLLKEEANEE